MRLLAFLLLLPGLCLLAGEAGEAGVSRVLVTFDAGFDLATVITKGATVARGGTPEAPALSVQTGHGDRWPGITITAPAGMWDLSDYEFLAIDLRNVDRHDIDVFLRVDNPGANGAEHCMTERVGTQPDQRVTLTIPLKRLARSTIRLFGMQGYPQGLYASGGIDPSNITALTVFVAETPAATDHIEIANIRVFGRYREPAWLGMDEARFFPCIDSFGQFAHKDWPGKVHRVEELVGQRDAEAAALAASPGPAGWDAWGGWAAGPTLEATGHFRTAKHQDRWWLVDPDGHLFFSTGITCVGTGWADTPVDDRERWFADLPVAADHPFHRFLVDGGKSWGGGYYAGRSPKLYQLSRLNLLRKYGADWEKTYPEVIHRRLRAWGLNTIGNWSDGRIAAMGRTPYTCTFWYDSPRLAGGFPDVFAPAFAPALEQGFARFVAGTATDPWCIGYFVDNEMPWGGDDTLARHALAAPAGQAAKQRLVAWLQERYSGIAALEAAWGVRSASWEAFAADTTAKPAGAAAQRDLEAFTGLVAETYFATIKAALRKVAPRKLYLGCRSVGGAASAVAAAVRHCDVVSYNRYCASVRDIRLPDGLDAPVIIGEFHFGGLDRGPFWSGLFAAESQEDRGRKYTAYVRSALDNPQILGVHWFQYGDEATTGRIDGENAQCGFVDVCDTPYPETIAASRASAESMYRIRLGGKYGERSADR